MGIELDVDALQLLPGQEINLLTEGNNPCTYTCAVSCTITGGRNAGS